MNITAEDYEVWVSPKGTPCHLVPVATPADFEWFAEEPGDRAPQFYEMRHVGTGTVVASPVAWPVAPWSPYDAISDKARAAGWRCLDDEGREDRQCEHGLSLELCSGPLHY